MTVPTPVRDWAALGIEWETESVSKQFGDHATDRKVVGNAQLPRIIDLDKARAAGISILAWINSSNSMRVRAQAIARATKDRTPEVLREAVFAALLSSRARAAAGVRVETIIKRPMPDGTMYDGDDEVEFRQLYAAALIDQGVEASVALSIANSITF